MTYRLYAEQWHLTATVTTGVFAVYPIVVVAVLVGFGDLSDHIGRRLVMLLGLGASLSATLLFAVAPDVLWLFAGRALTGIGVGLDRRHCNAALVDFSAEGPVDAGRVRHHTPPRPYGFTGALLLGGALTQYAPWPTHLGFWLLFALIALLFVATWFLRAVPVRRRPAAGARSLRPYRPAWRGPSRWQQARLTTAYTHGVLILSLGGQVGHDLVASSNALVTAAPFRFSRSRRVWSGFRQEGFVRGRPLLLGAIASIASMGLLALSVARQGLSIFLASTAIAGIGYSLLVLGGLALLGGVVPARHRGGVLSAPICSPTCRWASWHSAWASWRQSEGSAGSGSGRRRDHRARLGTIGLLTLQRMHDRNVPAAALLRRRLQQSA